MTTPATPMHDHDPLARPEGAGVLPNRIATALREDAIDPVDLALFRLEAFLDQEAPSLARVFSLLDLSGSGRDVEALKVLLDRPRDVRCALAAASQLLDRLVEDLAEIPPHAEIQRPLRVGDAAAVRDLDGRVRWLGARTEDMRSLLLRTLD